MSESICAWVATFCGVALYFVPAPAAVVGQGVYVSNTTMACPSIAALERYKGTAQDNPEQATKEALSAGCREVNPSEQGFSTKVSGAHLCVIFTADGGGCLWIPATARSGRMSADPNQDNSALSGFFGGLQKLFGGSH